MAVSEELIFRLQLHPLPQYKLAMLRGLDYTTLSQIVNGIERVRSGDEQVLAIGRVLGLNTITE